MVGDIDRAAVPGDQGRDAVRHLGEDGGGARRVRRVENGDLFRARDRAGGLRVNDAEQVEETDVDGGGDEEKEGRASSVGS